MRPMVMLLALAAALAVTAAQAVPHVPAADAVVLERLPEKIDPARRELRALRAALARRPADLDLAVRFARRAIEAAREDGDPRYLGQAQAALDPWWRIAAPPVAVLVLRATIRQSLHDFDGALADLDALLAHDAGNGQALLTRATVLTVRGRYAEAMRDCARLGTRGGALVLAACEAGPRSLAGDALPAYRALVDALATGGEPAVREWALTLAAEIAARRADDGAAEGHFRAALALDPRDPYLKAAYADFLLAAERAREVVALLRDDGRNDTLLLRLALAEGDIPERAAEYRAHRDELAARFEAARRRGDALHRREEARFRLALLGDAGGAAALARENWRVQREPADLALLVAAARAAGDPDGLRVAREWIAANRLEDASTRHALEAAR